MQYMKFMKFSFLNLRFLKVVDSQRQEEKTQAAADMKSRLGQNVAQSRFTATKSRHLPTAEEAKRIAKIFSSKAS